MQKQEHNFAGYKKIKIQQLEKRSSSGRYQKITQQSLIRVLDAKSEYVGKPVLCYMDTSASENRFLSYSQDDFNPSPFFDAFQCAYRMHGDVVLVPDEIWIMICFFISKYIDQNAEKLRWNLVRHEGTKNLTVVQYAQSEAESLLLEKHWDTFFEEIVKEIQKQTLNGVVQKFICDFSTTTKAHKVISVSVIMNTFKKFFKYQRYVAGECGIANVYMAGVREDWAKMIPKLQSMLPYDVDGVLKQYVAHMKQILRNFLKTFDGKPDPSWWNSIITKDESIGCCGIPFSMQLDGWILHFFGMYEQTWLDGFPHLKFAVPITLQNEWTNKVKQLALVSNWVSVSKLNEQAYKPDVAMCIFEVSSKSLQNPKLKEDKTKKKETYEYEQI